MYPFYALWFFHALFQIVLELSSSSRYMACTMSIYSAGVVLYIDAPRVYWIK